MKHHEIDIVVPVWNKPEETRQCLAALLKHTPGARFILLDNASERETESLLQEFADGLGDRSLLFRNDKNQDFVTVVNKGLAKTEAAVIIVVRNTTTVSKGWLDPMLELVSSRPDAGLAVPNLVERKSGDSSGSTGPQGRMIEIPQACFDAVMIQRELYRRAGGFDEGMDGGLWCLKDYSRRAWNEGFVTIKTAGPPVFREENPLFGSLSRREEKVRKSIDRFVSVWGREEYFFFDMSGEIAFEEIGMKFELFLQGARCGHHFLILARPRTYRYITRKGYDRLHENIVVERLPYLFSSGSAEKMFSRMHSDNPELKKLTNTDQLTGRFCRDEGNDGTGSEQIRGDAYAT
jgi:glycosyltransferase involved in cell wall biosynthesis